MSGMRGSAAARAVVAGLAACFLAAPGAAASPLAAPTLALQQTPVTAPRAAASLHPDTVRVGEPFLLGVIANADPQATLVFPVHLELPEGVEQVAPVEVRADDGGGTWRAYYRLVAWRPGSHELSAVRIGWRAGGSAGGGGAERGLHVSTPGVEVASVLPAEPETAELRAPRPFLRYASQPWPWILAGLLVLLAAAAATLWWRGRERPVVEAPPEPTAPPGERAVRSLRVLRARWRAGELDGAEFFDEWEAIVRAYVESTRGWPVAVPLRALADGHRPLADALERSTLVRFARLTTEREAPSDAAVAAIDWIRAEEGTRTAEGAP